MSPLPDARSLPAWAAALAWLGACSAPYPQRVPGPLLVPAPARPAAAGADDGRVTLQRGSDPVWVRRAGERGDVAVPFYAKRQRIPVGSLVRTGAGGRAEVLWGADATTLVLFDDGRVTVGDPETDEPVLRLHAVTHALLTLTPEDVVELPGGARLSGDASEPTGPFFFEQDGPILRLTNQSKHVAMLAFRSERAELGPGESIDLPRLAGGCAPRAAPAERLQGAGLAVEFDGALEREDAAEGMLLRARAPAELHALGIQVRLAAQESARFSLLSLRPADVPADASVLPSAQPFAPPPGPE